MWITTCNVTVILSWNKSSSQVPNRESRPWCWQIWPTHFNSLRFISLYVAFWLIIIFPFYCWPPNTGKIKKLNTKWMNLFNKGSTIWISDHQGLKSVWHFQKHIFHWKWHCYTLKVMFTLIISSPQL